MFRSLIFITILLLAATLSALPDFYPTTMIAEDFGATWCVAGTDAHAGIDVLHNNYHNGEFISLRYYSQSGDLSNQIIEDRLSYYNIDFLPTVIFNGTQAVSGGGANIIDGSTYTNIIQSKIYSASPIQIGNVTFNNQTGAATARVTMVSSTFVLSNQSLRFILIENDVTTEATKVVRSILSQPVSLSGEGSFQDFSATFAISPAYNPANLWLVVIVQLDDHTIIQSASTLTQPTYQIRAAMQFSPTIIDSANINYTSETVWFYNLGQADNYTLRLLPDNNPADWYLNYCNETGGCFPGDIPNPFSLAAGEIIGFHLNLLVGNSGISTFHFIVESPNISPYIVPFTYQTEDTPNDDQFIPEANVQLLQNYPNPFTNETTFSLFTRQTSQPVEIEIFNPKGQKVQVLNTGILKTGTSTITWNGTDLNGRKLPQGIYYTRIRNDNKSKTIKMLIMNNK